MFIHGYRHDISHAKATFQDADVTIVFFPIILRSIKQNQGKSQKLFFIFIFKYISDVKGLVRATGICYRSQPSNGHIKAADPPPDTQRSLITEPTLERIKEDRRGSRGGRECEIFVHLDSAAKEQYKLAGAVLFDSVLDNLYLLCCFSVRSPLTPLALILSLLYVDAICTFFSGVFRYNHHPTFKPHTLLLK